MRSFQLAKSLLSPFQWAGEKNRKDRDHYHLAIKLDRNQQWMMSKCYLLCIYGITTHYSSHHHNYILVLGCASQSLIENSRGAQGTRNDTTKANLALTWAKK